MKIRHDAFRIWSFFLLPSIIHGRTRQILDLRDAQPATGDLCAAQSSRATIAGDVLYFMGGQYTFKDGDTAAEEPSIFWLPLNSSFPVETILPSNNFRFTAADSAQWAGEGAFFKDANETMLYSFGGFAHAGGRFSTVSAFNITSQQWSNVTVSGGEFNGYTRKSSSNANSDSTSNGLGFITGGNDNLGGMVRFDASDPSNLTWTNQTNNNPPLTEEGSMEYVRFGKKGVLIAFGGYDKDFVDKNLKGWSYDLRPMSQIGVYDIDSSTWYNVTAQGTIPGERSGMCTAVSAAPDDSSFQITAYGGWNLFDGKANEDVFVLSLPSFQWVNVSSSSNPEIALNNPVGRYFASCGMYRDRQMIVLGGLVDYGSKNENANSCNDDWPSVRALDVSTFSWMRDWEPNPQPYTVPSQVTKIIGGSGTGGAIMTQPSGGFNESALNDIFNQTVARYSPPTATTTSSSPPNTTVPAGNGVESNSPQSSSTSSSSHAGPIAGGVVGGVAVLALASAGLWYLRRRRRVASSQPRDPGAKMELTSDVNNGLYYAPPGIAHYEPQEADGEAVNKKANYAPSGITPYEPQELGGDETRAEIPGSDTHRHELP